MLLSVVVLNQCAAVTAQGMAISVMELSKSTSIMSDDVMNTLQYLGLLRYQTGGHVIVTARELLDALAVKYPIKEPRVDASRLHWTPMLTDNKKDKFSIKAKRPAEEVAGV
jgi:histone acetyltransferase MYST1